MLGVPVHQYVQLVRMKRATQQLAFRDASVIAVALDAGYETPEAFARAFKQRTGQTPSAFRDKPEWAQWQATYKAAQEHRMAERSEVQIIDASDTRVACMEHRGDPDTIGETIRKFIAWRRAHHLPPATSATFNILYNDPESTPPERFRLDLCCVTEMTDDEVIGKVIPGGRCAVVRHTGSDDAFRETLEYLYGTWLPDSGEELRDFPLYCRRVTFFPDVPEHEAVTDFYLPLA
jgi:AraC family transcriptional regulator